MCYLVICDGSCCAGSSSIPGPGTIAAGAARLVIGAVNVGAKIVAAWLVGDLLAWTGLSRQARAAIGTGTAATVTAYLLWPGVVIAIAATIATAAAATVATVITVRVRRDRQRRRTPAPAAARAQAPAAVPLPVGAGRRAALVAATTRALDAGEPVEAWLGTDQTGAPLAARLLDRVPR